MRLPAAGALAITVLTLAILERHHPNLTYAYRDGIEAIGLINYVREVGFSPNFPFLNLQILGGFYGLNFWLSPSMWIAAAFGTGQPILDASYALCALELFLTAYFLARKIGASSVAATLSGILLPFFILPLAWRDNPFFLLTFCPVFGDMIVINNLILIGLADIFLAPRRRHLSFVLVAACVAWFALLSPLATLLAVPLDMAARLVLSVHARGRADFWTRQLFLGLAVAACLAFLGPLLLGLFANTSSSLFAPELRGDVFTNPWPQLPIPFKRWSYATFALVSLLLFWTAAKREPGQLLPRLVFPLAALFAGVLVLLSVLFVFVAKGAATFPRPWYFEILGWPLYFICWGFIIDHAWRALTGRPNWPVWTRKPGTLLAAVLVATTLFALRAPQRYMPQIMPYRPTVDGLTNYLMQRLKNENGPFAGQVAAFIAGEKDVGQTMANDRATALAVGNAHRGEMLRYFGLHTLDEYNSLIDPAKYLLLTRFMAHPGDDQSRAMTVYTRPDQGMLATLGVRLVVSDRPLPPPARLQFSEDIPGVGKHLVYELQDVNLGTYSPTSAQQAATPEQQLRAILTPGFDFRHTVVARDRLPALTPAKTRFEAPAGRYRVDASAEGAALLVLPVAYSRCLAWKDSENGPAPRLIRVDFALMGVLFERSAHGVIQPRMSPFQNPFCRLQDWLEMRSLKAHYRNIWPENPEN